MHPGLLFATLGAKGRIALDGDRLVHSPGFKVQAWTRPAPATCSAPASSTARCRAGPPNSVLRFANAAAGLSCTPRSLFGVRRPTSTRCWRASPHWRIIEGPRRLTAIPSPRSAFLIDRTVPDLLQPRAFVAAPHRAPSFLTDFTALAAEAPSRSCLRPCSRGCARSSGAGAPPGAGCRGALERVGDQVALVGADRFLSGCASVVSESLGRLPNVGGSGAACRTSLSHTSTLARDVLELAHVARPLIAHEHVDGRRRDAPDRLAVLAGELLRKSSASTRMSAFRSRNCARRS